MHELRSVNRSGHGPTVVLTTLDLNLAASRADRIMVLDRTLVADGPPCSPMAAFVWSSTRHSSPAITMAELLRPFTLEFFCNGLLVATITGGLCGLLGPFVVVRRSSRSW